MKTFKMLYKGFLKPRKFFLIFMLLIGAALAFISFMDTYSQISYELKCNDSVYGDYTGTIKTTSLEFDQISSELSSNTKIEYVIPFYFSEGVEGTDDDSCLLYGVDEEFWEHSEYELIEGDYPKSNSEIVCEPSYLYRLGYNRESMIGAEIMFQGAEYRVSGLYTRNLLYIDDFPKHILFTLFDNEPNALIYKLEDTFFGSDIFEDSDFVVETNVNDFVKHSERSNSMLIYSLIFIVLIVSSAFIISHCIILIIQKHRKEIAIYDLVGIPKKRIWLALFSEISISIMFGVLVGAVLYSMSLCIIASIYKGICGLSGKEILQIISFASLIKKAFIYTGILLLFVLIRTMTIIFSTKGDKAKNENNIRVDAKTTKLLPRITSSTIALRHFRTASFVNIITILTISAIIITFTAIRIFLNDSKDTFQIYEGYDYKAVPVSDFSKYSFTDFTLDDFFFLENTVDPSVAEIDEAMAIATEKYDQAILESEREYKELQKKEIKDLLELNDKNIRVTPIYIWRSNQDISISQLSDELKQYLSDYTDAHDDIIMGKEKIPLNIKLIGLNESELEILCPEETSDGLSLDKNKCIVFSHYTSNLKNPDQIKFVQSDNITINSIPLEIVLIKKRYSNKLINSDECIVICVSGDTFCELTNQELPSQILFTVHDKSEKLFVSEIVSKEFVEITDLSESIQVEKIKKRQNTLYIIATAFMLVFAIFSCILALYMRCILFEKEYATMNAIGLPAYFTRSIIFKELAYIIIPIILISGLFVTFIWKYISILNEGFEETVFPLLSWGLSCGSVVIVGLLCGMLIVKKFDSFIVLKPMKEK